MDPEIVPEDSVGVVVSVAADSTSRIHELASELSAQGLIVERVLESLGTITGRIQPARIVEMEKVEGVSAVERELTIQLPPPDSPVQ